VQRCGTPLATAGFLLLLGATAAHAQLPETTASRSLDLRKAKLAPEDKGPFRVDSFKERYRYQIAAFRRLLPLDQHLRRCVNTQRLVSGEFHDRLDFIIEPSGKLKQFSVRRSQDQLQACLLPHVLPLRFPPFTAKPGPFTLHVLVGSPGTRLGRKTSAKPVAVYPLETPEQQRTYRMAIFWVYSPWSQAISHCTEWVDQSLGFGYKVNLELAIAPSGRAEHLALEVRGKLADAAIDKIARCVTPFVKRMRVPKHGGTDPFPYRHGTSTAGWGIR
jgi:hypothetical protein